MKFTWLLLLILFPAAIIAQNDSSKSNVLRYEKPKNFSFITSIPSNTVGYVKQSFRKENLYKIGIIAGATALLYIFDRDITNGIQNFSANNSISTEQDFLPLINVKTGSKTTNIGKWPRNVNTAFYDIGQGSSVVFIAAGLFIKGKLMHDYKALTTASQLMESFIALGVGTQFMKYASGRETPADATSSRGEWRPFPAWSDFQNNKTRYDAFPSGHLATLVSAVTILADNYNQVKWIRPVGYTIAGLCGLAMLNNGVHWASDYPLGIALGYGYGKYIVNKNKKRLQHAVPQL